MKFNESVSKHSAECFVKNGAKVQIGLKVMNTVLDVYFITYCVTALFDTV